MNQRELLASQTNAEPLSNSNSSELIHKEAIPNSPFHLIELDTERALIALGKFRMSDEFKTYTDQNGEIIPARLQALEYVADNTYVLVLKMMEAVIHHEVRRAIEEERVSKQSS